MDLDLNVADEMTERWESSIIKPPSPTTEKNLFASSNSNGGHGDGFHSNQTLCHNSQREMNGDSALSEIMTQHNLGASEIENKLLPSSKAKVGTDTLADNDDNSDSDMPPLEYEERKPDVEVMNKRNMEKSECRLQDIPPETASVDGDNNWLDILGNGLVKKKVLVCGKGRDTRPTRGDRVVLDIQSRLEDGTEVENKTGVTATVAENDLNTAVDMCLALMEEGETCELRTDSKYAYGKIALGEMQRKKGLPPSVPAGAHLTYTLTLKDVGPPLDLDTLSIAERIKLGTAKRERGNFYFTRNEHPQALSCYNKAIEILRRPERSDSAEDIGVEEIQELLDVEAKCYNNLAAVQLKMETYDAAIMSSDGVIRLQPNNVKALFRKGKALAGKHEYDAAIAILRQALKIEPESKLIHSELSRLVAEQRSRSDREREVYKKMFSQDKIPETASNSNTKLLILGLLATLLAVITGSLLYNKQQNL